MKQGVLVPGRVRLLMKPGDSCFRGYGRRKGERRRKSVRGCIVSPDLSVLNLMIVKQGERRSYQHCPQTLLGIYWESISAARCRVSRFLASLAQGRQDLYTTQTQAPIFSAHTNSCSQQSHMGQLAFSNQKAVIQFMGDEFSRMFWSLLHAFKATLFCCFCSSTVC